MNNAFFVSRRQPMRDLHGVIQCLAHDDWSAPHPLAQRLAFQQLRDHIGRALVRANIEYRKYVGMVQSSGGEGFLLKAAQAVGIERESLRQYLDRYFALQPRVTGAINFTHPSSAQQGNDLVRPKFAARGEVHPWARLSFPGKNRTNEAEASSSE